MGRDRRAGSGESRLILVDRYCPNPDCPSRQRFGKRRWLCATEEGAYTKVKCPKCKRYWVWQDEELVEAGTLVLEDML